MRALAIAIVLAAAAPARADDASVAQQLYEQAKKLEDDGKLAEACAMFAQSFKVDPQLGTELNLADCHEKQGKLATAYAEFRDAVSRAHRKNDDREGYAIKRADALAPQLVRMHVTPPQPAIPSLAVKLDDSELTALVGTDMPVDPGTHVLVASAPGYTSATQTITIDPAKAITNVDLPPLAKAAVVADATQTTPEQLANALAANQRAMQKQRDDEIARVRAHVRPFVAVGGGGAGAVSTNGPGYGIGLSAVASVGARLGFASSFEIAAAARWLAGDDAGSKSIAMGVEQTSASVEGAMFDVGLRGRPLSPASHWYIGFGGGLGYITAHRAVMGQINWSGSFWVPYGFIETGFAFGKRDQFDLTVFRLNVGTGVGEVAPLSDFGTMPPTSSENLVGFTLHVGYTFF